MTTILFGLLQGTASVVLAGLLASLKLVGGTLADHTFLFLGAGEVSSWERLSYLFAFVIKSSLCVKGGKNPCLHILPSIFTMHLCFTLYGKNYKQILLHISSYEI